MLRLAVRSLGQLVLQENPVFMGLVLDICSDSDTTQCSQYDLQDRTKHELISKTYIVPFQAWLVRAGMIMHIVTLQEFSKPILVDVFLCASATQHN